MNNLKYIDCHSHPHDEKYTNEGVDVDLILEDLKKDGGATIAIGTDYENSVKAISVSKKHENVWATIGVHPADNHAEIWDERFEKLYFDNIEKVVGVGECGLDYYYFNEKTDVEKEKNRQKELFLAQINFAVKNNLPLVLHGRPTKNTMDAYRDMLDILENCMKNIVEEEEKNNTTDELENNKKTGALRGASPSLTPFFSSFSSSSAQKINLKGHAHFFVGNLEIAKRFLDLGFLMSFDGPITFTKEYDEVIKFLPIKNIMIETDSPYAAPVPHRGQINKPQYVQYVAEKIAELKNISVEEVMDTTKQNAITLFNLKI